MDAVFKEGVALPSAREREMPGASSIPITAYLIEAALVGIFIVAASLYTVLLQHPASPVAGWLPAALHRRVVMGLLMAGTALGVIYSPWGRRTGPLLNPAVVLCFLRLERVRPGQAVMFIIAQFAGALGGALFVHAVAGTWAGHPSVRHVVTTPGPLGAGAAWAGEFAIGFVLLSVVLTVNRRPGLAPYTGCFSAALIGAFIVVEAPLSGMSLSPARSFGPALVAWVWTGIWVYFTAPVAGMLLAVEVQRRVSREPRRLCGKLVHPGKDPCVFRCNCRHSTGIKA